MGKTQATAGMLVWLGLGHLATEAQLLRWRSEYAAKYVTDRCTAHFEAFAGLHRAAVERGLIGGQDGAV